MRGPRDASRSPSSSRSGDTREHVPTVDADRAPEAGEAYPDPPAVDSPQARGLRDVLVEIAGDAMKALLMYGSHLHKADARSASAWDLVVVVDDYPAFHRALRAAGHHRRPAWLLDLLARTLPPNVTAFNPGRPELPLAKCVIVDTDDFARGLAPRSPDHFLKGRMVQQVAVLWAASDEDAAWVRGRLAGARADVLAWAGPSLDGEFGPEDLALHMLRVSYAGEVRPEGGERVRQVFEAQRGFLRWAYTRVLERAAKRGRVVPTREGRYRLDPPPNDADRRRVEAYFRRSKRRTTLRWGKHILTFNDWLTYIQRKVERRTGMQIEVTPWERRLPLLLLWPKVFKVIRHRPTFDDPDDDPPGAGPSDGGSLAGELDSPTPPGSPS